MTTTTTAELADIAHSQSGLFTTAQARSLGISPVTLARHVSSGRLRHPMRGVYCFADAADPDPVGWHRQLCVGALLLYDDAVLCSVSAIVAHGLPVHACNLARPYLRRSVDRGRGAKGVGVRRQAAHAIPTPSGMAVPIPTALVEVAIDAGVISAVVAADAALHTGQVTADELADRIEEMGNWPGAGKARSMGRFADASSESVAESITRVLLALRKIDLQPQVVIRDERSGFVARVDFLVAGTKVVLEVDGKLKYAGADGAQVLWDEKRREDSLRRLGYVVVRIYWSDLEQPRRLYAKVFAALRDR